MRSWSTRWRVLGIAFRRWCEHGTPWSDITWATQLLGFLAFLVSSLFLSPAMITRRLSLSMIMMMALVALVLTSFFSPIDSFTVVPQQYARAPSKNQVSSTTQLFFFGGPKDDGSPGDYVCKVSVEFNKCLTFTSNQIRAIFGCLAGWTRPVGR